MDPKRPLRKIAKQYTVTVATLHRHKTKHLLPAIQLAKKEAEIKEGKTAFEQFTEMVKEAESKYNNSSGNLQVSWFREWRAMLELAFKLGIEEARQRDQQVYHDMTPAVKAIIDKEFEG